MAEFQADLNRLAGTTGLDAQGAANAWAATSGLDLVGALNVKNGTTGLEMNRVVRALAATFGGNPALDWNRALATATAIVTPEAPDAPTIGTATAGDTSASVAFTPPIDDGGSAITGYTATSSPGAITASGASSPISVPGLTNGVAYTFTVHATNGIGNSAESAASNSVTPVAPAFSPDSISGLLAWFKADALVLSNDDPVASWTDSSGDGHNLTQGTGGAQPLLKTNVLNSLPIVRFDGTDDFLVGASALDAHHWIVVAKYDFASFPNYIGLITGTVAGEHVLMGASGSDTFYDDPGQVTVNYLGGVASLAAPMTAFGIVSASIVAGWNYTSQMGKTTDNAVFWQGDIAEAVAYDAVLSTTDLNSVAGYLADKYGLAWADI